MTPARTRSSRALLAGVSLTLVATGVVTTSALAGREDASPVAAPVSTTHVAAISSAPQVAITAAARDRAHRAARASRGQRAVAWAHRHTTYPSRTCLMFVRKAFGVSARYPTAQSAWQHARYKHASRINDIPAGVPVFTKGASAAGHVVVSLGNGWVRSTDWPRDGRVGNVRLSTLLATWNHRYLGWTQDINGVRVSTRADRQR